MKRSEEIIHGRHHDIRIAYEGHQADITSPLDDPHFIRYGIVSTFTLWGLRKRARKIAYQHIFAMDILTDMLGENHE